MVLYGGKGLRRRMVRFFSMNPRFFVLCTCLSFVGFVILFQSEWKRRVLPDLQFGTVRDNTKPRPPKRFCHLKNNIVFLKVHKAGSSTVMNVLQRFGLQRGLNFVLPKRGHYLGKITTLKKANLLPLKANETYNILCNHVVYNRTVFGSILKHPMFYFAILRSPFNQFVSAFNYYSYIYPNKYLLEVPKVNPITEYLKNPLKYESFLNDPRFSYTNSRMAFDLGLNLSDVRNEQKISEYIKILEADFHFIMIMEYFEVSMVLLKRYLCWDLKDILFVPKNIYSAKKPHQVGVEDLRRHRAWSKADYMIYEHFLIIFWKKVYEEGPDLALETEHYRSLLTVTRTYCKSQNRKKSMTITQSKWNEPFELTSYDCDIIMKGELPLVYMLQSKHKREHFPYSLKGKRTISK